MVTAVVLTSLLMILSVRSKALVPGRWQLFNIKADPAEAFDLAAAEPARLRELIGDWEAYSARNGVILPTSKAAVGAIKPGSDPNAGQ